MKAILEKLLDRMTGRVPPGADRHKDWPRIRNEWIRNHPECAVCGRSERLQAHHIIPFHVAPELELEPVNLVTLCTRRKVLNCHLVFGHLGRWTDYNPNCIRDAQEWNRKLMK
jgi:hypothetical protein